MKMKEKKEEIVEEVVEVNNELLDYLEFARQRVYQLAVFEQFIHLCGDSPTHIDQMLKMFGVDISKPVKVNTGYTKESILEVIDEFVGEWIETFNELDLSKIDNYTKVSLEKFVPNPCQIAYLKERLNEINYPRESCGI